MAITSSILTGGVNSHPTTSEEANGLATDFVSEGIVGTLTNTSGVAPATGGFAVNAQGTPDATVAVSAGVAYVTATPTSQNSQVFRVKNTASANVTISANSSGSTKYDWIYISLSASTLNAPAAGSDGAATLVASRSTSQSTDDGTPPTYGYPIAVVTVANGFSTITNGNIRDVRSNCIVNLGSSSVSSGWTDLGYTPNTITNNGQRSVDLVFNSVDLTSTLSVGMRLKLTRLVTAPTQCADLEAGSSQYFQVTNATGLATGTTWTFKAKIKPESYGAMTIVAIDDGTNLVQLTLGSSGQVNVTGGTTGASDIVTSYQSVELGRWQDITGSITIGTPTGEIRIDDVVVPSFVAASAATTMTISGDEEIYIGRNSAGNYFDGKICQVAIFNAIISDATLKTYSGQTMTGSETNCEGFWSLNGTLSDLSANANTMVAGNSATATNPDSPFGLPASLTPSGTTEYAIITASSFSTNTTLTVQLPWGCAIPTSGGISAVAYSPHKAPFGMPVDAGRWGVLSLWKTQGTYSPPVSNTWYNLQSSYSMSVPVGAWSISYGASVQQSGTSGTTDIWLTLATTSAAETDTTNTSSFVSTGAAVGGWLTKTLFTALSAATTHYLNIRTTSALVSPTIYIRAENSPSVIVAVPAYL